MTQANDDIPPTTFFTHWNVVRGGADDGRAPPARPRQAVGVALAAPFPRAAFPHSLPTGSTPRCRAWQRSALVALMSVSGNAARVGRLLSSTPELNSNALVQREHRSRGETFPARCHVP